MTDNLCRTCSSIAARLVEEVPAETDLPEEGVNSIVSFSTGLADWLLQFPTGISNLDAGCGRISDVARGRAGRADPDVVSLM